MTTRLIEKWLPIAELGIESTRERAAMTPFPAPNRMHVWWARRPLVAARAAVLASLLPEDSDRRQFLDTLGILGDPVATKLKIDSAKRTGERLGANVYGYKRAFTHNVDDASRRWIEEEIRKLQLENPVVLDPTSGGGSIPLESARLGFVTHGNELNPVAAIVLRMTVEMPFVFGTALFDEYQRISEDFVRRVEPKYSGIFPEEPEGNRVDGYLWARTVDCPYCAGSIPLSPNWRLAADGTGVQLNPDVQSRVCSFKIVSSVKDQSEGTVSGGDARCPYPDCKRVVDSVEVRRQAQAGQMGEQLYAIAHRKLLKEQGSKGSVRTKKIRAFRAPTANDNNADLIRSRLDEKLHEWEVLNILPSESVPNGLKTRELTQHGSYRWQEMFSPRQLLCHGIGVETFREMYTDAESIGNVDEATKAAFVYFSFALDKLLNYGARSCRWDSTTYRIRSVFDTHNFAFISSYAEMAPMKTGFGYDWAITETGKCIKERVSMSDSNQSHGLGNGLPGQSIMELESTSSVSPVMVTCGSADNMAHLEDGSVDSVVMDPPYYDNVMYAELSDFFYVWLKRTAGFVYPEWFLRQLTDKDNEAVANSTRFSDQKGARGLANRDYQQRMAAIFAECRRVLKPDGVMTLMFTHKATGAWDALTKGLVEGGFTITASWPINTEASGSLHIREKSAANSTIFLVCRPRAGDASNQVEYWEDVVPLVTQAVRERVEEYQASGITGVDLYLACFGPALQVFAEHWPLKRGQPRPEKPKPRRQASLFDEEEDPYEVTPEDALEAARSAVKEWRLQQIVNTTRRADLELITEWFVLAWDTFRAPEFPYDEALRLARVVGLDLDSDVIGRLAEKKASNVVLWDSAKRAAKGALGPPDGSRGMIDALHHAAHMVRTQGLNAGRDLLERSGAENQSGFAIALTALLEVLPVSSTFTHVTGETGAVADAASDFDALENLRRLAFTDRVPEPQQLRLWMEPVA